MAHYVLYLPHERFATPSVLEKYGLSALADNCSFGDGPGPEGRPGGMLSWYPVDDMPGPNVDRTWQQLPGKDVWLGIEVDRPVKPRDLARQKFIPGGQWVRMADNQEWFVPIASQMPMLWGHDEDGGRIRKVRPEYSGYFERSEKYYLALLESLGEAIAGKSEAIISWPDGFAFCTESLALNYRLTEEIACLLGILDDSAAARLISTVCCRVDITEFALKKKDHTLTIPAL